MKTDQFIRRCLERGKGFGTHIRGWEYNQYAKLAVLTGLHDYGCDHGEDGLCFFYRHPDRPISDRNEKLCCYNCAQTAGHTYVFFADYKTVQKYARLFREDTGFWRAGKGCALPREARSPICLTYYCRPNQYTPESVQYLHSILQSRPKVLKVRGKRISFFPKFVDELRNWIISETSK